MERGVMLKNIDQKLACQNRIHIDTCADVICKQFILFNDNQGTGLYLSHIKTGLYQFADGFVCKSFFYFFPCIKRYDRTHDLFLSKLLQCFTQLRLENNNYTYDQCTREI